MGEIVQFRPRQKKEFNRVEALMKGQIETYVCNNCGSDIEVAYGEKPDKCPSCGFIISDWREE